MDEAKRLELITEAVIYCKRVRDLGMPPSCYSKALREPVHFLWERQPGGKDRSARFRSVASLGVARGKGRLVYDHAVPFRYLQSELLDLKEPNPQAVRETLARFEVAVLITTAENTRLNAAGLGNRMPPDWDGTDALARYRATAIELTPMTVSLSARDQS